MEEFKPVPTRASKLLGQNQENNFQAIIFEEPKFIRAKNRDSTRTPQESKSEKNTNDETDFDIKKARHEVLRFAMTNQRVIKNKKKMEIFHAIKLGAKPPKKPYKNYKVLLEERKRLNNIREERKKFHMLGKNQTGAASIKCRSKTKTEKLNKKKMPVSVIDKHYGKVKPKFK